MAKGARHELRSKGKGVQKTYGKARDRTRADKPKLIEDPELEEQVLRNQLREAGLYAANVLGDGNCLFRALSDQLYGSPSMHLAIRQEVCDYLSSHPDRFRLFVDEDSVPGGFEDHVRSMRQPGTYGTNIEISAFVARYRRPVKIWQPNLIYVMPVEESPADSGSSAPEGSAVKDKVVSPRERRALERAEREREKEREKGGQKVGKGKQPVREEKAEEEEREGDVDIPLCIVYHSWEHYSSLRNLTGPHTGPPRLRVDRVGSARPEERATVSKEPDEEAEEPVDEDEPMADEPPSRRASPPEQAPPGRLRPPDRQSASSAPPVLDLPHPSRLPPLPTAYASRPRSPPPTLPSSAGLLSPPHASIHDRAIALPLPPSPRPSSPADSSSSGTSTGVASSSFGSSAPSTVASSIRDRSMSPFPPSQSAGKTGYAVTEESPLHDEFHQGEEEETDSSDAHRDKVRSRSAEKEKLRPLPRTRRGPTAKEKKELARQRRMERRRAKGVGASGGLAGSSDRVLRSAGPASDAGLAIRELYI